MATDITKEKLDQWWRENKAKLLRDPNNWDYLSTEVMIENEYKRQGIQPPTE